MGGTAPVRETATGSVSTTTSVNSAVVNAASATATAGGSIGSTAGEPTHGPLSGAGGSLFKYVVYKQPLSLDRFYIHDVLPTTEGASELLLEHFFIFTQLISLFLANLKNGFVLVCLNRFQQVITLHTFQAASESAKVKLYCASV